MPIAHKKQAAAPASSAAKVSSKGGYEPLHLCSMGGHVEAVEAIIEAYPEGALKKDHNGRTPLDEAREGSSPAHEKIVELLLALPGVAEADEAEAQLRASYAQALMRPDDDEAGDGGEYSRSMMGAVVARGNQTAAGAGGGPRWPAERGGVAGSLGRSLQG